MEYEVFENNGDSTSVLGMELCTNEIVGDIEGDKESWHRQTSPNSCDICVEEFVAEQLLDKEFSEQDFAEYAENKGWYDYEKGTYADDFGKILEDLGLEVERGMGYDLQDIAEELKNGGKVMCHVNSGALHNPEYAEIPGLKGDHMIQVIGIDATNPADVKIIINDSGVPEGEGCRVDASDFLKAWEKSGNLALKVRKGE